MTIPSHKIMFFFCLFLIQATKARGSLKTRFYAGMWLEPWNCQKPKSEHGTCHPFQVPMFLGHPQAHLHLED